MGERIKRKQMNSFKLPRCEQERKEVEVSLQPLLRGSKVETSSGAPL